ncbi:MAG: hypothetical protein EBX40_01835 [Gammaproteobacteria bacterium]|nr:hypothetical protein [Gammaproteobacteria bacterium]
MSATSSRAPRAPQGQSLTPEQIQLLIDGLKNLQPGLTDDTARVVISTLKEKLDDHALNLAQAARSFAQNSAFFRELCGALFIDVQSGRVGIANESLNQFIEEKNDAALTEQRQRNQAAMQNARRMTEKVADALQQGRDVTPEDAELTDTDLKELCQLAGLPQPKIAQDINQLAGFVQESLQSSAFSCLIFLNRSGNHWVPVLLNRNEHNHATHMLKVYESSCSQNSLNQLGDRILEAINNQAVEIDLRRHETQGDSWSCGYRAVGKAAEWLNTNNDLANRLKRATKLANKADGSSQLFNLAYDSLSTYQAQADSQRTTPGPSPISFDSTSIGGDSQESSAPHPKEAASAKLKPSSASEFAVFAADDENAKLAKALEFLKKLGFKAAPHIQNKNPVAEITDSSLKTQVEFSSSGIRFKTEPKDSNTQVSPEEMTLATLKTVTAAAEKLRKEIHIEAQHAEAFAKAIAHARTENSLDKTSMTKFSALLSHEARLSINEQLKKLSSEALPESQNAREALLGAKDSMLSAAPPAAPPVAPKEAATQAGVLFQTESKDSQKNKPDPDQDARGRSLSF